MEALAMLVEINNEDRSYWLDEANKAIDNIYEYNEENRARTYKIIRDAINKWRLTRNIFKWRVYEPIPDDVNPTFEDIEQAKLELIFKSEYYAAGMMYFNDRYEIRKFVEMLETEKTGSIYIEPSVFKTIEYWNWSK